MLVSWTDDSVRKEWTDQLISHGLQLIKESMKVKVKEKITALSHLVHIELSLFCALVHCPGWGRLEMDFFCVLFLQKNSLWGKHNYCFFVCDLLLCARI